MPGDLEAENAGRLVLAVLLLDAGRVVPADRLLAALRDGEPPTAAAKQMRNAVSRLRRLLASAGMAGLVLTKGAGYQLAGTSRSSADTGRRTTSSAGPATSSRIRGEIPGVRSE